MKNIPFSLINSVSGKIYQINANRTTWSIARKVIEDNLQQIHQDGTWKNERIITTAQDVHIQVNNDKKKIINFCANNYLGLSVRLDCKFLFFGPKTFIFNFFLSFE